MFFKNCCVLKMFVYTCILTCLKLLVYTYRKQNHIKISIKFGAFGYCFPFVREKGLLLGQ